MKIVISLLIACLLGFPINSYSGALVVGSVNCREWIADRANVSDYMNKNVDQSWVVGFLSGYSVTANIDFLADIKTQSIYVWMDKYCASHPNKKIDDGSLQLVHELIDKMPK